MITRIKNRLSFCHCFPNYTLLPDWDILEELVATINAHSIDASFQHIKGHQDDHTEYNFLSKSAKLNILADQDAVFYQEHLAVQHPISSNFPSSGAQLIINNQSISGHYTSKIREAASLPLLLNYIRKRNFWTKPTLATVHLSCFRLAIKQHASSHRNIVKLVHDKLPTSEICQYTNPNIVIQCPFCNDTRDTFDHHLRCPQNGEIHTSLHSMSTSIKPTLTEPWQMLSPKV